MDLNEWEQHKLRHNKRAFDRREERVSLGMDDGEPRYIFVMEEQLMEMYEKIEKVESQMKEIQLLFNPTV